MYYSRFIESGHAENRRNRVEAGLKIEAFLEIGGERVDRDGDPDSGLDGVLRGAEEAFDAPVPFDPFEERLDLPAPIV